MYHFLVLGKRVPELRKVTALEIAFGPCDRVLRPTLRSLLPKTGARTYGFLHVSGLTLLIGSYPG